MRCSAPCVDVLDSAAVSTLLTVTVTMSGSKKSELELRDKAILHQQRRLKQATQFSHKDSADLLPLDGLKRLGTSKDLVSTLSLPPLSARPEP